MSGLSNKTISPNKKFYAKSNGALLNVYSTEDDVQIHSLPLNQYELRKPDIFRWSRDSQAIGMLIGRSLPFDAGGWTSHRSNYWVGIWYPSYGMTTDIIRMTAARLASRVLKSFWNKDPLALCRASITRNSIKL